VQKCHAHRRNVVYAKMEKKRVKKGQQESNLI